MKPPSDRSLGGLSFINLMTLAGMPFIFIIKTSGRFIQISGCESIILNK